MSAFRQLDEKHVVGEVTIMLWSPKMDLIALALVQGEVALHRLSWQKVWMLSAHIGSKERQFVTALSWRPDGKMLAVAYDSGHVSLCDVENGAIVHSFDLESSITCLSWTSATRISDTNTERYFVETSSTFLPKLPSLTSSFSSVSKSSDENVTDMTKINDQETLNVLIAGTKAGFVHLYSFGLFPSGELNPSVICPDNDTKGGVNIISVAMSEDFNALTVLLRRNVSDEFYDELRTFKMPLMSQRSRELRILALKFGKVSTLMSYLDNTIKSICEAWEDILLEIDSKLTNFAEQKHQNSSGTVSDDFLELLIFGTATVELEKFLLQDLTEKGLKKLGHSIELSYSNIQKLVLKHLQNVGHALMYHLSEIKGMSLWHDQFGVLGLATKSIDAAIRCTGAFMMKATEIQQVIDSSMKNFKAFFRWLYAVILRLCDEPIPTEFNKVTQQDLNFVAEFLIDNFTEEWSQDEKCSFHLERVGQYLKNEALLFPPSTKNNPWVNFLEKNPSLKENAMLFPHETDKSLIQQHKDLQITISTALKKPSATLGETVELHLKLPLFKSKDSTGLKNSHLCIPSENVIYTAIALEPAPCTKMFIIRQSSGEISSVCGIFGKMLNPDDKSKEFCYEILDFHFYNEETISLLLLENSSEQVPVMVQLPLKVFEDNLQQLHILPGLDYDLMKYVRTVDIGQLIEQSSFRKLENVSASSFSVSGTRKVACVLFASRRRVRLFEMDAEDEEDEETTDINMSKESIEDSLNDSSIDPVFSS